MSSPSRTTQFNKVHKVLKKHYKTVVPDPDRSVLEHLLFACCAENAHYDAAEESFAALVHNFYDFNEIRVSSIRELAEVMSGLPDPAAAANRVKRVLQSVFESTYSFELEHFSKLNLGPASEKLAKIDGTTNFGVSYVIQAALGGHAIPVDLGALRALFTVSLVSEADAEAGAIPGMERAIAKSKGVDFASLLHQLGADFIANPYSPALREILTEIDADAAKRLPRRRTKKQAEAAAMRRQDRLASKKKAAQKAQKKRRKEAEASTEVPKPKLPVGKKPAGRREPAGKQKKTPEVEKTSEVKKKPAATKKNPAVSKSVAGSKQSKSETSKKKSGSAGMSKRKPR